MASFSNIIDQSSPRILTFAGKLRRDLKLLEVREDILEEIISTGAWIKGLPHEEAVLCSSSATYALKHVETTNTLLMLAPHQAAAEKVTVEARTDHQLEIVRIAPNLQALDSILQESLYCEVDESAEAMRVGTSRAPAADGALDTDACEAPASPSVGATFQQLLQQVQASDAELRGALKERGAICLAGRWRLLEASYLGHVLELLLLTTSEHHWPRSAVPAHEIATHLCKDAEIDPRLTLHCLSTFGAQLEDSESDVWALDDTKTWKDEVPEDMVPHLSMLRGEVLLENGELYAFSAANLPKLPAHRFAALFAHRPIWTADDIPPYMAGLEAPGQSSEALLLRYTRASQFDASSSVTYSARC